jgi:hypothetical protein
MRAGLMARARAFHCASSDRPQRPFCPLRTRCCLRPQVPPQDDGRCGPTRGDHCACILRAGQAVAMPDARSGALSGDHLRSYMNGGDGVRPGRAMPSEQHKPHDPAILIWVPVGETPTRHAFAARGASTFSFLPDAVIHAQKDAAHRPEKPWISTSNSNWTPTFRNVF